MTTLGLILAAFIGACIAVLMWLGSIERELRGARRDWPTARRLRRRDATVLRLSGAKVRK